jgi:hypothetical protein
LGVSPPPHLPLTVFFLNFSSLPFLYSVVPPITI